MERSPEEELLGLLQARHCNLVDALDDVATVDRRLSIPGGAALQHRMYSNSLVRPCHLVEDCGGVQK